MGNTGPNQRRVIRLPGDGTVTAEMLRRLLEDDTDVPDDARLSALRHISDGDMVTLAWDEEL